MVFSSISSENSPLHWISTEHKLQSLVSVITPYGYSSQLMWLKSNQAKPNRFQLASRDEHNINEWFEIQVQLALQVKRSSPTYT